MDGWGGVADSNYLYPAHWGWINSSPGLDQYIISQSLHLFQTIESWECANESIFDWLVGLDHPLVSGTLFVDYRFGQKMRIDYIF